VSSVPSSATPGGADHAAFLERRHFACLDGLRALSILAVIWHHCAPSWAAPALAHLGNHGVTLFFAISGFLITTLLLRERSRHGRIDLRAFYWRRALRIFPLYYAVLGLYLVLVLLLERSSEPGQAFLRNLPYFATYTSNLFVPLEDRTIFYFSWSLATEEQFYLLWPPLLCLLGAGSRATWLLLGVAIACLLGQLTGQKFLAGIPLAIVAGSLMAILLNHPRAHAAVAAPLARPWAPYAVLVLLSPACIWEETPAVAIHLLLTLLVGCCVVSEDHLLARLLRLRPLVFLGSISYGMYLLHMLCKNGAMKLLAVAQLPGDGILPFIITTILAVALAAASFRWFETPFLALKHRHAR
jgi:peptidoglycan/LPS O-acetylase OafA/YrhL